MPAGKKPGRDSFRSVPDGQIEQHKTRSVRWGFRFPYSAYHRYPMAMANRIV